jgi:hypothetical protein
MVIDAHMLVPEKIIKQLMEFVTTQNMGGSDISGTTNERYWKNDELFREKAEALILAFREDFHVEKLSFTLSKFK